MKICWDNLEKFHFNKRTGKWYLGNNTYIYVDECKICKEPYLANLKTKNTHGNYCCNECQKKDKEWLALILEKKRILYEPQIIKYRQKECLNCNNIFIGQRRDTLFCSMKCMGEYRTKTGIFKGENNSRWKGGVFKNKISLYDTFADKLDGFEEIKRDPEIPDLLNVKCTYCGDWIRPNRNNVYSRIEFINGTSTAGEGRFYCKDTGCKDQCPIYWQKKYPKGYRVATSREVSPELRKEVFLRDNYICQICGSNKNLHCHHMRGAVIEPIFANDPDWSITLCKLCHKLVHSYEGCSYYDLRCNK